MDKYLSNKLKIISFFLIVLVLYIHSGFPYNEINKMALNLHTQRGISSILGRCAVPLFYIISGYLFFYTAHNLSDVFLKIKKRFWSLVIPYIIGCIYFIVFFLVLSFIPNSSQFINGKPLFSTDENIGGMLYKIFYDSGSGTPIAFHLWFLRDLIILAFTSPIWFYLYKKFKWIWVPIVGFLAFYYSINQLYALLWFSIGGAIPYTKFSLLEKSKSLYKIGIIALFIFLSFLELISFNFIVWSYLKIPLIIIGVLSIWYLYDFIIPSKFELKDFKYLAVAVKFTFFIYLFHEPSLNIVRKLILFIFGRNGLSYLISYLFSPLIFVILGSIVGLLFKKGSPNIYKFIIGGR